MRYTYLVNISNLEETWNNFDKETRRVIRKCPYRVHKTNDILWFDMLHYLTRPDRKIGFWQILWWWITKRAQLFTTGTAMAMIGRKGQYLLAARIPGTTDGSPSKILWEAMRWLNSRGRGQIDLCGANRAKISHFKKGFGGKKVVQKKTCLSY
jgi:hypothetical protein